MEGNITLQEFYNALEAYNCSGEKHTQIDDYYVAFEHRAMFKFLQILKERNISHQELFRSCDVNNDGNITIRELENVIQGISPEFYLKETQAIHNFFDIDRNGLCSEKEYMTQIAKAEVLFTHHNERLAEGKIGSPSTIKSLNGLNNDEISKYI